MGYKSLKNLGEIKKFFFLKKILLIYPLAVTLYQVSTYGFWITMIFFAILTVGFVLEIGSGALYFTDQKTSVVSLRPEDNSPSNPLLQSCLLGVAAISVIDCSSLNDWLETPACKDRSI